MGSQRAGLGEAVTVLAMVEAGARVEDQEGFREAVLAAAVEGNGVVAAKARVGQALEAAAGMAVVLLVAVATKAAERAVCSATEVAERVMVAVEVMALNLLGRQSQSTQQ